MPVGIQVHGKARYSLMGMRWRHKGPGRVELPVQIQKVELLPDLISNRRDDGGIAIVPLLLSDRRASLPARYHSNPSVEVKYSMKRDAAAQTPAKRSAKSTEQTSRSESGVTVQ